MVIVEYHDPRCPNCADWESSVTPGIEQQHIVTGKVRLELREFPFMGKQSTRAALAVECAGEQGKFWDDRATL